MTVAHNWIPVGLDGGQQSLFYRLLPLGLNSPGLRGIFVTNWAHNTRNAHSQVRARLLMDPACAMSGLGPSDSSPRPLDGLSCWSVTVGKDSVLLLLPIARVLLLPSLISESYRLGEWFQVTYLLLFLSELWSHTCGNARNNHVVK